MTPALTAESTTALMRDAGIGLIFFDEENGGLEVTERRL
jgi:hypothetical protein